MNKILAFITLAAVVVSFNSCKKGEEDPFLTFKSRDSRIQGEWLVDEVTIVKSIKTVNTTPFGATNTVLTTKTYVITKDGKGTLTSVVTENGSETSNKTTELTTAEVGLTINEDGSYVTNDKVVYKTSGEERTYQNAVTGQWVWGNGAKNKNSINFSTTSNSTNSEGGDFSSALLIGDFNMIALSADQLKIEQNFTNNNIEGSDLSGSSETETTSNISAVFRK